jgi:Serine dehydrogenase proteinase
VAKLPGRHDDQTLLLADVGRKAIRQVESLAVSLLERHADPATAREVAHLIATGVWTHDHPLMASDLQALRLPIRVGVSAEERALMNLYPQSKGRESAVEYTLADEPLQK